MSSPTPVITPPPKKAKFNLEGVTKRASTWLAAVSASTGAAAAAFMVLPGAWQATFPEWAGQALAFAAVASAGLIPIATSYRQKSLNQ
jgi:hypothetical protein